MRFTVVIIACLLVVARLGAGEKPVRGKVTYLAAGTIYTSVGREQGLRDSTLLVVVSRKDTIATLRVMAFSSHSSSCLVVRSSRPVSIGDDVFGKVVSTDSGIVRSDSAGIMHPPDMGIAPVSTFSAASALPKGDVLELHGRLGAQYITTLYEQSAFNVAQPGVVLSLHGVMRDVPLRLDMYANFKSLALGGRSPLARSAVNQSRVYGLSLSYDDNITVASLGRIIPFSSPSIGYVDGALLSRKFGNVVIGTVAGYQPDWTMRSVSTDFRKFAVFAQYSSFDRMAFSMSAAYARTYYRSNLDREAASLLVNSALTENLYLYGNAELDLRKKLGEGLILSPMITSAYGTLYCRIIDNLTVGLGFDAARSYYSFEAVRLVPDSLLVNTLRSGMMVSISWYIPGGFTLQDSYAPRSSLGPFGQEYSNSSALNVVDIFSTGVSLRCSYNTSRNEFTMLAGYGLSAQATIARTVDLTLRYQENGYTVKQTDQHLRATSLGGDLMIFLARSLTFLASYDRRNDYGMTSHAVFAEFGFRF